MSLYNEVVKAIEEKGEAVDWMYADYDPDLFPDMKISLVDDYGGEDCGSTFYTVYKFERGDETAYVQFDGYYQSYAGAEYEGMFEVSPKEVTKIEYVKV